MAHSIVRTLLERLAAEQRHVVSDWRAMVLLQRAARELPPDHRPGRVPTSPSEARGLLNRMVSAEDLHPIEGLTGVYEVTVPYAKVGPVSELEILMEVHPCVAASHHTALAFHGLTDDLPKTIHAMVPLKGSTTEPPPGTTAADWESLPRAPARFPEAILDHPVRWHRVQAQRFTGIGEYRPEGWPVRVTSPERTLLDGLLAPEDCGGFENVLRAWTRARDLLDVGATVQLVERLDVGVLRQRAGFLLEALGLTHAALDAWRARSRRGGSSRLYGGAPYASTFDERWNLSLNAPIDILHHGEAA